MRNITAPKLKHTVLIVEDDSCLSELFAISLELDGYDVLTAANGQEALDILSGLDPMNYPQCILLDIMMPVMDGRTFLNNVEAIDELNKIPVVVCSAFGDFEKSPQVQAKMAKPINLDHLSQMVARVLNPHKFYAGGCFAS